MVTYRPTNGLSVRAVSVRNVRWRYARDKWLLLAWRRHSGAGRKHDPLRQVSAGGTPTERQPAAADLREAGRVLVQPSRIRLGHAPLLRGEILPRRTKGPVPGDEPWTLRNGTDRGEHRAPKHYDLMLSPQLCHVSHSACLDWRRSATATWPAYICYAYLAQKKQYQYEYGLKGQQRVVCYASIKQNSGREEKMGGHRVAHYSYRVGNK